MTSSPLTRGVVREVVAAVGLVGVHVDPLEVVLVVGPLEVVGLALAECLELRGFAVQPGRPRGRVVGLERWSTGRGNVASLGGLVMREVVVRLVARTLASARARWWPSSSASASSTRARRGVLAEVVAVVGLEHG